MTDLNDLHELLDRFATGTLETDKSKPEDLRGRQLYLYGAGNVGKRLFHNLKANGITVAGFIDRNPAVTLPGIDVPVHLPDDPALATVRDNCTVILSGLFPLKACSDIKAKLSALGFRHVHALHEVNFNQVNGGAIREILFDDHYNKLDILGKDRHKVDHAFSQLQDESSRRLFLKYLESHLPLGFSYMDEPIDIALQYLAHDIPEIKDYSHFVDCGGYDGDTFRQLTAHGCHIRRLAIFEPQIDMYSKYAATVKEYPSRPEQAFLFPCGVYAETTQLRFATNIDAQSSAKVSASGDSIIQCVSLDEALQGFAPTFIKMDIEGAETAALKGAQGLIETYGPSLAICIYHRLSDLWEIPWLISSMRSDYRYYLRNYNYLGLETVLYAFRDPFA